MSRIFKFCPHCRTDLALREIEGLARSYCPACGEVFFRNAKPCAGAFVTDGDGRVLLARRAIDPYRGCWDVPGGYLEETEHPEAAAIREVREETGLTVAITGFGGIYMDRYGPNGAATLNIFYDARVLAGDLLAQGDVSELAWFTPDALPFDTFSFENGRLALADWRRRQPGTAAE